MKLLIRVFAVIFLFIFIIVTKSYGHNGKSCIVKQIDYEIKIDGNLNEWSKIHQSYEIAIVSGQAPNDASDLKANFRIAQDCSIQKIFLAVVIQDEYNINADSIGQYFGDFDSYILHLNFHHTDLTPGVFQIRFSGNKMKIRKHGSDLEPFHADFDELKVNYKFNRVEGKSIYEIEVDIDEDLNCNSSIGIDHLINDKDEDQKSTSLDWGHGTWKYYMPGNLGDAILTDQSITSQISGHVKLSKSETLSIPNKVRIESVSNKSQWIISSVDSLGNFEVTLPKGSYRISSGISITNPGEADGYGNQIRIDHRDFVTVDVNDANVVADTLKLSLLSPPSYLIRDEGVLHNYDPLKDKIIVDNFIESYRQYYQVPAVSLAIVKGDELVYKNHFGHQNTLRNLALDSSTVFQIASVSKSVFAFIVLRLADKNIIDLEKPLYKYLPFKNIMHNEGYEKINARLVLSHQTGLDNWPLGGPDGWMSDQKADFKMPPGTGFSYSGEAYQWLGRVVEKITSKSLETLLEEEFKTPLGISNFHFKDNSELTQTLGSFTLLPDFWGAPPSTGVAHSILTEAKEFSKFLIELGEQKLLKSETYKDAFFPTVESKGYDLPSDSLFWNQRMGLGFYTRDSPYGKVVMHSGNNADFQCEFIYYLEKKMGFVIMTNSNLGHKIWHGLERFLMYGNG